MTGALESNAGDRYHFAYAARRMLDMLHPRSDLRLIVMENVSPIDQQLANDPDSLLGVDLTEYYGGEDFRSASRVEIVQVKYSSKRPDESWTLSRLCKNKTGTGGRQSKTSVLYRLSEAYKVFYNDPANSTGDRLKIVLYTNQPLSENLRCDIVNLKQLINGLSDEAGSEVLKSQTGGIKTTIDTMISSTDMTFLQITSFLKSWDISGFSHTNLAIHEAAIYEATSRYTPDCSVDSLIGFIQSCALPTRRTDISKNIVLANLQIRESDFFPAPLSNSFSQVTNLQITEDAKNIKIAIDSMTKGILLVKGISGTGKSTSLHLLQKYYPESLALLIYDCFDNGSGLQPGSERFPYKCFTVQVVNELDAMFETNILSTTKHDYRELWKTFRESIARSADCAKKQDRRLLICIDAVDNAVVAANRNDLLKGDLFLKSLWGIAWPDNCIVILTARSENKHLLNIPANISSFHEIEISGFNEQETLTYLQKGWTDTETELLRFAHERTKGNPRVLSLIVESSSKHATPNDQLRSFIDQKAKDNAFKYYEEECKSRLQSDVEKLVLSILHEAVPFLSVDLLTMILDGLHESIDIRTVIESLSFGLKINENSLIFWRNQDFLDFACGFVSDFAIRSNDLISDFCEREYRNNDYAKKNLSSHLFRAKRYNQLVSFLLNNNLLKSRLEETQPYAEDILKDVQYGILAASESGLIADALKLLSVGADIIQGKDVFNSVVKNQPEAAVLFGYESRLSSYLEDGITSNEYEKPRYLMDLAIAISKHRVKDDISLELIERASTLIQKRDSDTDGHQGYTDEDVLKIAHYHAYNEGYEGGLASLREWTPEETIYPIFDKFIETCTIDKDSCLYNIIRTMELSDHQRAYCLSGLLASSEAKLPFETFQQLSDDVIKALQKGVINKNYFKYIVPNVIETLLLNKLKDSAKAFMPYWQIPAPEKYDKYHTEDVLLFLKMKSYEEALSIQTFLPDKYKMVQTSNEYVNDNRERQYIEEDERNIRSFMCEQYPSMLIQAIALVEDNDANICDRIRATLNKWVLDVDRWYYKPKYQFSKIGSRLLKALTFLKSRHEDIINEICRVTTDVLCNDITLAYTYYADVLSNDPKYQAVAEKILDLVKLNITAPEFQPRESIEQLLKLCCIVSRFDSEKARQLFYEARIAAARWDADIDSRVFAILKAANNSLDVITREQSAKLAFILKRMKQTAYEEEHPRKREIVNLISRIDTSFALDLIKDLETEYLSDEKEFTINTGAACLGIYDSHNPSAKYVWPLYNFIDSSFNIELFKRSIESMDNDKDEAIPVLEAYAKYISNDIPSENMVNNVNDFIEWAEEKGFEKEEVVQRIKHMGEWIERLKMTSSNQIGGYFRSEDNDNATVYKIVCDMIKAKPQEAMNYLNNLEIHDVKRLKEHEMQHIINELKDALPSVRFCELMILLRIWDEDNWSLESFRLLLSIPEKGVACTCSFIEEWINTLKSLLTPYKIRMLSQEYYQHYLTELLDSKVVDARILIKTMLCSLASCIQEMRSEDVYRLIGLVAGRLDMENSFEVFKTILDNAIGDTVITYEKETTVNCDAIEALVRFLCHYAGHPRRSICWKVVYTLANMIIYGPENITALVIDELKDDKHERWITKREWLLFTLQYVSQVKPSLLIDHLEKIRDHALSSVLPHAKIRYHAKEILLNIEKNIPGTLTPDTKVSIESVNMPKSFITREEVDPRRHIGIPYNGVPWRERYGDNEIFHFDSTDTLPYWYDSLGDCFCHNANHVADIAFKWIVERWDITNEKCREEIRSGRDKYDWRETRNDHGSEPAVENLQIYAERHGMFMAAGEMIDTLPVYCEGEREGDRWTDWMKYHLRGADPSLIGRLIDSPPLCFENYGVFKCDYETWIKRESEEEYTNQLVDNCDEWTVVAASIDGDSDERSFRTHIISALARQDTAPSLARLINSGDEDVYIPYIKAYYKTILNEFEQDIEKLGSYYISIENDYIKDTDGMFLLTPFIICFYQEMPLHSFDPKWPNHGRNMDLPNLDFCNHQELHREPNELVWKDSNQEKAAYAELWNNTEQYRFKSNGYRLLIRKDILCRYLKETNQCLFFKIKLQRHRPYNYRSKKESYDRGKSRAYIFTAEGVLL